MAKHKTYCLLDDDRVMFSTSMVFIYFGAEQLAVKKRKRITVEYVSQPQCRSFHGYLCIDPTQQMIPSI